MRFEHHDDQQHHHHDDVPAWGTTTMPTSRTLGNGGNGSGHFGGRRSAGEEKRRMRAEGVFLGEWAAGGAGTTPAWCAEAGSGAGFLVAEADEEAAARVARLTAPLPGKAEPTPVELTTMPAALAASPSGRSLAAAGHGGLEVYDLASGRLRARGPGLHAPAFAAGESIATARTVQGLTVLRLDRANADADADANADAAEPRIIPLPHGRCAAVHPEGSYAVVDHPAGLAIVDLEAGTIQRVLSVRARQDVEAVKASMVARLRAAYDEACRGLDERTREGTQRLLEAMEHGGLPGWVGAAPPPEQVARLAFSENGGVLLAATNAGVRAWAWSDVLHAEDEAPPPLVAEDASAACDVLHDAPAGLLLFCGIDGSVRTLDLAAGHVRTILEVPGRSPVVHLALSADRGTLMLAVGPSMFDRTREAPVVLQAWDYGRLIGGRVTARAA